MTRKQKTLFDLDAVAPVVVEPVPEDAYQLAREVLAAHDESMREWNRKGPSWEWMFQNAQRSGRAEDLGRYPGAGDFREAAAEVSRLISEGESDKLVCESSVEEIEAHMAQTDAAIERLRAVTPPKSADVISIKRGRK